MKLISALAQAVLGQHVSPGRLGGGRAAGSKGARRHQGLRRTPSVSPDILEETLEARLTERIGQLEATIAERERNERVLRRSEKLFRSLVLHNVSDIITVLDASGTVRFFESPAIERVLGYKAKHSSERAHLIGFIRTT